MLLFFNPHTPNVRQQQTNKRAGKLPEDLCGDSTGSKGPTISPITPSRDKTTSDKAIPNSISGAQPYSPKTQPHSDQPPQSPQPPHSPQSTQSPLIQRPIVPDQCLNTPHLSFPQKNPPYKFLYTNACSLVSLHKQMANLQHLVAIEEPDVLRLRNPRILRCFTIGPASSTSATPIPCVPPTVRYFTPRDPHVPPSVHNPPR
eukprot:GHVN01017639.1.p1 GENE.GHVN01017639.1~~GHVN01017639.1.p1  ORF type:complete len:202 (-),score=20.46 GHVN01017639.1:649-1254(-)